MNIGAAARAMSNFGASRLRLVNPYAVAFREARSAVGASAVLKDAEEFKAVSEAVSDCPLVVGTTAVRNRALQHPLRYLSSEGSNLVRSQLETARVALLFGSEKIGLTNEDFSHCHWLLNIRTEEGHISMNLGQAVAVCLYALASLESSERPMQIHELATAGELEEITKRLLEALHKSGYVKPGTEAVSEKKVRRLVRRFNLEAGDATVLLGMVRQIAWKLKQVK